MNIFSTLIDRAQEAATVLQMCFPIGSPHYEHGIKLKIALEPFREIKEPEELPPTKTEGSL